MYRPSLGLTLSEIQQNHSKSDKAHCHMELILERLHSLSLNCTTEEAHCGWKSPPNPHPFLKELGSFSLAFVCNVRFQTWGWEGYGLWNAVSSCGMSILSLLLWGDFQGIEAAQSEPVPPDRKAITWATSGKPCYLQVIPVLTGLSCHTR